MEFYEAKKELKSYLDMETSKQELQEWIDSQKYDNKITASVSGMPKGTPIYPDQMAEKLSKALDKETKLQVKIDKMNQEQDRILDKILNIEKPYQTALFCLYIQGKTIEQTGISMNYSRSQIIRITNKAIDLYAKP